jgi:hypothetical protein
MRTKEIILCGALTLLAYNGTINAQTATVPATLPAEAPKEVPVSTIPKIGGFIGARFQNASNGYVSGKTGFDLKNAIVDMTGNYSKTINYRLRGDFAGVPHILDAYAEWKPLQSIGLQIGQFQLPYTYENQYIPKTLECADYSQVIAGLVFNASKGRDIGIAINGSFLPKTGFNLIEYKLAVLNGSGYNKVDDNSSLDLLGNLNINPIKALSIGASYLSGKTSVTTAPSTIPSNVVDKTRTALGLKFDDGKALFRAEYVMAKTNTLEALGYYAVAGYFVTKTIQPILKYDFYQSNKAIDSTGNTQYVVGLNYWMASKTRILLSYNYNVSKDATKKDYSLISTGLIVSL